MTFVPRTLEDGRTCCSSPTALCPKCEEHFTKRLFAPDPYTSALARREAADESARLRALAAASVTDGAYDPKGNPPDSYALALLARREAQ